MSVPRWKETSEENVREAIKLSISYSDAARRLSWGDMRAVKTAVNHYGIDVSHLSGQRWVSKKIELQYTNDSIVPSSRVGLKKLLIKVRGKKCEICGLFKWQGKDIYLEIHHIDGNRRNRLASNVQLLCPNCHSYTDNFRGLKRKSVTVSDEDLSSALLSSKSIHAALKSVGLSPTQENYGRTRNIIEAYKIEKLY
jgi:5-methylcytosine-specific restriction endonuclease McrA